MNTYNKDSLLGIFDMVRENMSHIYARENLEHIYANRKFRFINPEG